MLKLPLRNLTLLSGTNASGKSSVLQAIVLLHQTIREQEWSTRLMLNGTAIQLGTVSDVVDQVHGRHEFNIGLHESDKSYRWKFMGEPDDMSIAVHEVSVGNRKFERPENLHNLLPSPFDQELLAIRLKELTYLTAERLGPRDAYPLEDPQLTPVVGPTGEHTVSILYSSEYTSVLKDLVIEDSPPTRIRQVEAWMAQFFPTCKLDINKVPRMNAVTLGIRTSSDTDFHRPGHTGFGVTQVLPLIVAAISAKRGDILLVENPEVHLHPRGQATIGEFFAKVASAGVQIILESHSDHVLNGIRRAVKSDVLSPDDVALHFFRPRQDSKQHGISQVQNPMLDTNGNIDIWPDGFFDQFDKDSFYFADWG